MEGRASLSEKLYPYPSGESLINKYIITRLRRTRRARPFPQGSNHRSNVAVAQLHTYMTGARDEERQ